MLFSLALFLFLFSSVARAGTPVQCDTQATRCQAVCTQQGVDGTILQAANCPIVAGAAGPIPRCDVCPSGRTCDFTTGQCLFNSAFEGRQCFFDAQCNPFVPDLTLRDYVCNGGFCEEAPGQRLHGDECTSSAQCKGFMFCNGLTDRCEQDGGNQCNDDLECGSGSSCQDPGLCFPRTLNQNCGGIGGFCLPSQVCNAATLVCQNTFTLGVGANCGLSDREKRFGCSPGLQCTANFPGQAPFTCQSVFNTASPLCNAGGTLFCSTQHACSCNTTSAVGNCFRTFTEGSCASQYRAFVQCTENNNCRYERLSAPPGSCVARNCASTFYSVVQCLNNQQSDLDISCNVVRNVGVSLGILSPEGGEIEDSAAILPSIFY